MNIGKLIRQKVDERGITIVRLARELSYSRTNIYKIFNKRSIDTEVLLRISSILEFDFFSLYSCQLKNKKQDFSGTTLHNQCPR